MRAIFIVLPDDEAGLRYSDRPRRVPDTRCSPLVIEYITDDLRRLLDLGTRHIEMGHETHTVLVHRQDQHLTLLHGPLQTGGIEARRSGVELQEENIGFHLLRIDM